MAESAHGTIGTHEEDFVRLVPARRVAYSDDDLFDLAVSMDIPDTVGDGPDAEENLFLPAGYTYLGQFVDHDLTLDTTSNLNPDDRTDKATNIRTPALDLDCVYGNGPSDQPYLFEADGATLRIGRTFDAPVKDDLLRNRDNDGQVAPDGRAIIGDKRNDENSIVSQIQLAMIKFHNAVVAKLATAPSPPSGNALFEQARREVTWTYQRMLVEDYLRRIVEAPVYEGFVADWTENGDDAYRLFTVDKRDMIPLEFSAAAYRFGHSMVRIGYRLNTQTALPVFDFSGENATSLTGFQPLPSSHVIDDWGRFFPDPAHLDLRPGKHPAKNIGQPQIKVADGGRPAARLQFAYKIDPSITGSLDDLPPRISAFDGGSARPFPTKIGPALSFLNLRRGNKFRLASGQKVAAALGITPLAPDELRVRRPAATDGEWTFESFRPSMTTSTPLWVYILAEAQRKIIHKWHQAPSSGHPGKETFFMQGEPALSQLGPVGGRIVMETFYGLLDADLASYFNAPTTWTPLVMTGVVNEPVTFSRILKWTGLPLTDVFGV